MTTPSFKGGAGRLVIALACLAVPEAPAFGDVDSIRSALQAGAYETASAEATASIGSGEESADEVRYLGALALQLLDRHDEAVAAADDLLREHPESRWHRKAIFLKSRSLVALRRFAEAEAIYEIEARRLLSEDRKASIAGILVGLADELRAEPDPHDVGAPPPDYARAATLYARALEMEIGPALRDDVLFRLARASQQVPRYDEAVRHFTAYLETFDPAWPAPAGTIRAEREGSHIAAARYRRAESYLAAGRRVDARRGLEDLLALLDGAEDDEITTSEIRWLHVRTFGLPDDLSDADRGLDAARSFLLHHRADARAVESAWLIAWTLDRLGRADEAVEAYRAFMEERDHDLPDGAAATRTAPGASAGPAELQRENAQLALFRIGQIRFGQARYEDAIDAWRTYAERHPNGPSWANAQRQTIEATFMIAMDAIEKDDAAAMSLLEAFLRDHPLDGRAPDALFLIGRMHEAEASRLAEAGDEATSRESYEAAMREWSRLAGKYAGTAQASHGLYRSGVILEERLRDVEKALDAYRAVSFGPAASLAQARIANLTETQLSIETPRAFRTDETPYVTLRVRNVETLTVRRYTLDPEAYFRKMHTTGGVETLDIALIEPDRSWEVAIEEYARYAPFEMRVEVPFDGSEPGVCLLNLSNDELETTALVIRSDLEVIARSSRREVLVFAQDARLGEPAPGATVLLSDGREVFASGATERDGVYRGRFDALATGDDLRVLVLQDGHVAANELSLQGLTSVAGLTPRGYVYTDRSAYRPGEMVHARAVVRDVRDGSYQVPAGRTYAVTLHDPRGRFVQEEETDLSDIGALATTFSLDATAPPGEYRITVRPTDEVAIAYTGTFGVHSYELPSRRLIIEFERPVYVRGETVEGTIRAEYQWGAPIANARIDCTLPDGLHETLEADESGVADFAFDTRGIGEVGMLLFRASLEGDAVFAQGAVLLPSTGFELAVSSSQPTTLAGEPVEIEIEAHTADGTPAERDVVVSVRRWSTRRAHPVFTDMPMRHLQRTAAPVAVTIDERTVRTDAGRATVRLTLDEGGRYEVVAIGRDRFDRTVRATGDFEVSGDDDTVKLRLFADADRLRVGETAEARLHSRAETGLALLTWEGETVLAHRVVRLEQGDNALETIVEHVHYPNFALTASTISDGALQTARREFTVERELRVTIATAEPLSPGETASIEITTEDQLGRPVPATLSLAMVDAALDELFPDGTTPIGDFFEAGARRHADFRVGSSAGFSFRAGSRDVVAAIRDEERRLVVVGQELRYQQQFAGTQVQGARGDVAFRGGAPVLQEAWDRAGEPVAAYATISLARKNSMDFGVEGLARLAPPAQWTRPAATLWWSPAIMTDDDGRTVVELPVPDRAAAYRLTARGVTKETLAGEAHERVVARRDLFVEVRLPSETRSGDRVRPLARIHHPEGTKTLTLATVLRRDGVVLATTTREIDAADGATTEVLLDPIDVPDVDRLTIEVTARTAESRHRTVAATDVAPWGMEHAAHRGGVSASNARVALRLPEGHAYTSGRLSIEVGASIEASVIAMAMQGSPALSRRAWCYEPAAGPGSDLLAALAGLEYGRATGAAGSDIAALERRARALVGSLVVSRRDDGGWTSPWGGEVDWATSSVNLWALAEARRLGLAVEPQTIDQAVAFLRTAFQGAAVDDHERRAVILHALGRAGVAEYELANALYRHRASLGPLALASTAITLSILERDEMARELTALLKQRAHRSNDPPRAWWTDDGRRSPHLHHPRDVSAMALLALLRLEAGADIVEAASAWLMDEGRWRGGQMGGVVVSALASYHATVPVLDEEYRLTVLVNGNQVRTFDRRSTVEPVAFVVGPDLLADGENVVAFELEGRGRFTYDVTLRGFSSSFDVPRGWRHRPSLNARLYWHAPLLYRGRPIGVESTSPVEHLEAGGRMRVFIDLNGSSYDGNLVMEEPLPAGCRLVPGSLNGRFTHHEILGDRLVLHFPRGTYVDDVSYQLVGMTSGVYRVPPTVLRDATHPDRVLVGKPRSLTILEPGEASPDPYELNDAERFALGQAHFDDGEYRTARGYLEPLFQRTHPYREQDVARMLLWVYTDEGTFDARGIVETFEVLSVRHPTLTIPFEKILVVGRAYGLLDEHERSSLVYRATIESSFLNDSGLSAVLQDEGLLLPSIRFQEALWWEYPDHADVAASLFALSQQLYENAGRADELAIEGTELSTPGGTLEISPTRIGMLLAAIDLLESFRALYPTNPLADDAAFSLANALLELRDYEAVVRRSRAFGEQYGDSPYAAGFRYMVALGHFWLKEDEPALEAARLVAEGDSADRDYARYILAQIHHARQEAADAIRWYEMVRELYPDADEAIRAFERQAVALDEVTVVGPGDPVILELRHRNVPAAHLRVYKVDLMKLYLREKSLSEVTEVNLAGVRPLLAETISLGDGLDYRDRTTSTNLDLHDEGAYLVICRGENLFASGLVLITALEIEVQEDAPNGRVRVNFLDTTVARRPADVHVKVIGSADDAFRSGDSDLRGVFTASGVRGTVTAIARAGESRYAFYRGEAWLGTPEIVEGKAVQQVEEMIQDADVSYDLNLLQQNKMIQQERYKDWDGRRRSGQRGVQIDKAQ